MIRDLDHVQVAAPPGCEEAARAFYAGLLGLEEIPMPDGPADRGGARFRAGSRELHIGAEEGFRPARQAHPALRAGTASELRALAARLDAAGHPVAWARDVDGAERFFVDDPFGNRIEVDCAGDAVELVMVAEVPPDGVDAFRRYEDLVLPLLARHGGSLERRLVSPDRTTEVHLVRFRSRDAVDAYRADPQRLAQAGLLRRSGARVVTFEVA